MNYFHELQKTLYCMGEGVNYFEEAISRVTPRRCSTS
jgi:hypothetical protein